MLQVLQPSLLPKMARKGPKNVRNRETHLRRTVRRAGYVFAYSDVASLSYHHIYDLDRLLQPTKGACFRTKRLAGSCQKTNRRSVEMMIHSLPSCVTHPLIIYHVSLSVAPVNNLEPHIPTLDAFISSFMIKWLETYLCGSPHLISFIKPFYLEQL